MKLRRVVWVLICFMLTGCAIYPYIPSKHVTQASYLESGENRYEFYRKQINGKVQRVFRFADTIDLVKGMHVLANGSKDFELYYELQDEIQVEHVMTLLRSLSFERMRLYYGSSHDFGMMRVELLHEKEQEEALAKVREVIQENQVAAMDLFDQVRFVHDYLVRYTVYDSQSAADTSLASDDFSLTAYGALIGQKAVCEGYARSFLLFMDELGIPAYIVEAQEMNHAWNAVKLADEWYYVDVTFDDPVPDQADVIHDTFFLLSKEELIALGQHIFDDGNEIGMNAEQYEESMKRIYP